MSDEETQTVVIDPAHKDFCMGYDMGVDALELMQKHVLARSADHEPLLLMGMMTVLMECFYRACMDPDDVDELIQLAQELAKKSEKESAVMH